MPAIDWSLLRFLRGTDVRDSGALCNCALTMVESPLAKPQACSSTTLLAPQLSLAPVFPSLMRLGVTLESLLAMDRSTVDNLCISACMTLSQSVALRSALPMYLDSHPRQPEREVVETLSTRVLIEFCVGGRKVVCRSCHPQAFDRVKITPCPHPPFSHGAVRASNSLPLRVDSDAARAIRTARFAKVSPRTLKSFSLPQVFDPFASSFAERVPLLSVLDAFRRLDNTTTFTAVVSALAAATCPPAQYVIVETFWQSVCAQQTHLLKKRKNATDWHEQPILLSHLESAILQARRKILGNIFALFTLSSPWYWIEWEFQDLQGRGQQLTAARLMFQLLGLRVLSYDDMCRAFSDRPELLLPFVGEVLCGCEAASAAAPSAARRTKRRKHDKKLS